MWWALAISKALKVDEKRPLFHEEYWKLNEAVMEFVEQQRAEKRPLLVHCFAGMNRSAALCAAYLMMKDKVGLNSESLAWLVGCVDHVWWIGWKDVKSGWLRGWWFSVVFWWFGWPLSTGRNEWASSEWWNFWVKSVDGSSATSLNRWSLSILVGAGNSKPKYGKPNIKSLSDRGTSRSFLLLRRAYRKRQDQEHLKEYTVDKQYNYTTITLHPFSSPQTVHIPCYLR